MNKAGWLWETLGKFTLESYLGAWTSSRYLTDGLAVLGW